MPKLDCIKCKGKYYTKPMSCGHNYCPIYSKIQQFKTKQLDKDNFVGTAPSVFVGRFDYPNLNVGIMAPPDKVTEDAELYDAPRAWSSRNFKVEDVLSFRGSLINSRFKSHVKSQAKYLDMTQEVAMSSKPVDVEFKLEKKPRYWLKTSDVETVMGAYAGLKKASFNSTPKVAQKVDKVVSDIDLKAADAINYLYKKNFSENFLTKILSVGTLGVKKNRKLVPTRWSITATDDTIGKQLIKEVKDYKETNYQAYFGGYIGNYFLVLMFPRVWGFELFEMYMPGSLFNQDQEIKFTTDHELYTGRKNYANNCAGGYYACRLGILEQLKRVKRQSAVIVLRFTTEEYSAPLGVWVVRQATRNAFQRKFEFDSEQEMLEYAKKFILTQFNYNIDNNLKESKVLKHIRFQKSLREYF